MFLAAGAAHSVTFWVIFIPAGFLFFVLVMLGGYWIGKKLRLK